LRRIFGPKGEEVAGHWRRLLNEELHNLHVSPTIIRVINSRRIRWAGHVAERDEKCIQYLVGKHEGKILLEGSRRRWEDNIRMDLRKTGWEGIDWMHLTQEWTSGGLL